MNERMDLTWTNFESGERVVVSVEMPSPLWWRNVKTGDEVCLPVTKVQHYRAEQR